MGPTIVVVLIGAILGFTGVFFGYNGAVAATLLAGALAAYYVRLGRHADVGWLLIAGGAVVVFLLGRGVIDSVVDPAVRVFLPTYLGAAAGVVLLGTGAMILGVSYASRRRG